MHLLDCSVEQKIIEYPQRVKDGNVMYRKNLFVSRLSSLWEAAVQKLKPRSPEVSQGYWY